MVADEQLNASKSKPATCLGQEQKKDVREQKKDVREQVKEQHTPLRKETKKLTVTEKQKEDVDLLLEALSQESGRIEIPIKWLEAAQGNKKEAKKQWLDALKWRKTHSIDNILTRKPKHYDRLKAGEAYGWYGLCHDKSILVVQKIHEDVKKVPGLLKDGVTAEEFGSFITFLMEFWIQNRLSSKGKMVQILDCKGMSIASFSPSLLKFMRPANHALQQYPEILEHCYVINAPVSYRVIWSIVSTMLPAITLSKFSVVSPSKVPSKLLERVPESVLPIEYGGKNDTKMSETDFETLLKKRVSELPTIE